MNSFFDFSFTSLLDLIETLAVVGTLVYGIIAIKQGTRTTQEQFVNDAYENFQELQLAFLENPENLKIIAVEAKMTPKSVRKNSLASLQINGAYRLFRHRQKNYLPDELWEGSVKDMQDLFAMPFVHKRWEKVKTFFPKNFQRFIADEIQLDKP